MREVVKINNEQEWEYVKEKINNPKGLLDFKRYESTKGIYINVRKGNYVYVDYYKRECYIIISFEEFKSRYEPQLKIGDTFEYNGFICEVKEKIEEKNWYRIIDRIGNLYFEKMPKERAEQAVDYEVKSITEITNKEFIKKLEENAL